jgi:integrase
MAGRRQHGEGSVYQRGRKGGRAGQWVAVADLGWKGRSRDRREFTGATPDEALAKRERFLDRRRDGFTMPRGRQPYVSEWLLHWLHNVAKRKVAATTWHGSYRQKVEDLIVPYFERVPLPELCEEDIEEWHRQLEGIVSAKTGRPLSASTISQAHRIFSTAIKAAVARRRIGRNPLSNVTPPRAEPPPVSPPTTAETAQLLVRCQTWPRGARWILGITTGLRQGEVLALEWPDVRLAPPAQVSVRRSAARVRGEGRVVKAPKSQSSRRTVPLPAEAVEALRALRASQPVRGLDSDLVFRSVRGRPVHPKVDYADWTALLADLGLPHYRVHDLRHGYATMLLEQGVDPRVVQDVLGHSTGVLLARYQHVRETMHAQAADAISRALRG